MKNNTKKIKERTLSHTTTFQATSQFTIFPAKSRSQFSIMLGLFYFSFILVFFPCCVTAHNRAYPPTKFIKLSLAISKATYLPLDGNRFIKYGAIIENRLTVVPRFLFNLIPLPMIYDPKKDRIACRIRGWTAKPYENKETEVIMFKNDQQKLIVFGFRGTEAFSIIDWGKDFTLIPKHLTIGETTFTVHKGISDRYDFIASWFEEQYQNVPQDYTVIITGHSLGGAEATIAAVYAAGKLRRRPDAVITYGSLYVGQNSFTDYYNQVVGCDRTLRIAAKNDFAITFVPIFGYIQVCNPLKVDVGFNRAPVNTIRAHDLYGSYDRGIEKIYPNQNEVNFGCDQLLN